jgi:signal transduction histidine kinase
MNMDRDRDKHLRWLFVLLALIVPSLAIYDVYYQFYTPTVDFATETDDMSHVGYVVPGGRSEAAGLEVGDRILTVDGIPSESWYAPQLGQTHTLVVERDGRRLTLDVPAVSVGSINRRSWIVATVVALVFWGVACLLLWRRFHRQDVRLLFLLAQVFAVAAYLLLAHPAPWRGPPWMSRASIVCFHLAAPLLVHHTLTFPVSLGTPRTRRRGLSVLYVLAMVAMLGALSRNEAWIRLGVLYTTLEVILAVSILIHVYLRRATPDGRRRLRLIVIGNVLAATPNILFYLLPTIAGIDYRMPEWAMGLFLALAPLCYLYATIRHSLFGIDRLLNRTLVYALLSLGILALYLGPSVAIYRFLGGDPLTQMLLVAALTLVVGISFDWVRTRVQRLVDGLFYGGWYDYAAVVETISDALARSLDRRQLADILAHQVSELMQLDKGQLWIGAPGESPPPGALALTLRYPLAFQGQVRGVWTVGRRRDGEDFTTSDRRIIETLAHQAEIALSNVLLVETLRRQLDEIRASRETLAQVQRQLLRSREDERGRLARDLHDGPVQVLVALNLQLGLVLPSAGNDTPLESELRAMRGKVRGLLGELRQVCVELRPPMLDLLGLGAALRALAEDWADQSGVAVDLDLPPDAVLPALPGEVAVNLYRVAQEALSNTARHAEATVATIGLYSQDGLLVLSIRDDGRGFAVPATLHDLAARDHFGLVGIQERVRLIDGACAIKSEPGRGTIVEVTWRDPSTPT